MNQHSKNRYKITVVGSGYVGMSLAVLFSQNHDVTILDIDKERVEKINNKKSTIVDSEIDFFLKKNKLSITATLNPSVAYKDCDYVVVATPTDFDLKTNYFDTGSVDSVVKSVLELNKNCTIIIKSTIPIGHTKRLQQKYSTNRIIFSPEFLREGKALHDNLYPSRIILGGKCESAKIFANLLKKSSKNKDVKLLFMTSNEAESVKLFANTYLAMRVAFFNELDSFAMINDLDTRPIINGVCLDERIGDGYNNPSFGYGGYCFPKDTKQLLSTYNKVPQSLIGAVVSSNEIRMDLISEQLLRLQPKVIGFYRLIMKEGSDNFKSSSIKGVIKRIKLTKIKIILFEPEIDHDEFDGLEIFSNLEEFKNKSDVIVANRLNKQLEDVDNKIFSRDLFGVN
ncbi:MAG: UDP-glucose 6-dehydrogenase [Flavobacteriales bacterium]|nr:UDP-glucose 6-dehydrogenase [Flavobacteriales bacterium]|tara:strand:+ start:1093 stop:2283 length:1191 start_codon:yes stop_codon:yes gene_type:complete